MKDSVTTLLPCPFCGAAPDECEHEGLTMSRHYTAAIACSSCDDVRQEAWGKTKAEALANATETWNKRTA